jgi:hypothetical protein
MRNTIFIITAAAFVSFMMPTARAGSFTPQVFATGSAIGATSPDSVTFGDGSVWVSYQNGADSTGASGSSTVARYSLSGAVMHTWTIAGNVDGLKVDPSTGLVWALQNNDGNSALTVIDPTSSGTTSYSYGSSYTNVPNRGFDDVVFSAGKVFLSETNPASGTDPVIVQLTSGLNSPLVVVPVLSAGTLTDPDSLKLTPNGDLALTGEADQSLTFVHNPGTVGQTTTLLALHNSTGGAISGLPDDIAYATATGGFFFVADTGSNTVYMMTATGLTLGSAFINVGSVFGSLDLATGNVTPIFTGVSPHGMDFVSFANAPEPDSLFFMVSGLLLCAGIARMKRRSRK